MVSRWIRPDLWAVAGATLLLFVLVLLRFSVVTDYLYHGLIKDPARLAPSGDVIVAPADGYVLYVNRFSEGELPDIRKKKASISVRDFVKGSPSHLIRQGFQVGIYMQTHGVHINRVPDDGVLIQQIVYNGPHLNMTKAEQGIILAEMLPGLTSLRKILGLSPYNISDSTDYVYESARETLVFEHKAGFHSYVVRIADYFVGKILTWKQVNETVTRGEKLGLITWGSQTDLFLEATASMKMQVSPGDYVYAGETVLASY
jgi:phosphatidylserine decarboxylase